MRALRMQYGGKSVEAMGPITWGVRLRSESGIDPWRIITYDKGSWIIHMLRRRMGDQAFLSMLGELRKRHELGVVSTDQFRQLAAEFSPKDAPDANLEGFFDTWVYSTGIPTLELKTSVSGKAPKLQLTVTVTQTGVGDDFSIDVPVEIWPAGAKAPIVKWVRTSGEGASVKVTLPRQPQRVELAPGNGGAGGEEVEAGADGGQGGFGVKGARVSEPGWLRRHTRSTITHWTRSLRSRPPRSGGVSQSVSADPVVPSGLSRV
jgi:hypothetical protein